RDPRCACRQRRAGQRRHLGAPALGPERHRAGHRPGRDRPRAAEHPRRRPVHDRLQGDQAGGERRRRAGDRAGQRRAAGDRAERDRPGDRAGGRRGPAGAAGDLPGQRQGRGLRRLRQRRRTLHRRVRLALRGTRHQLTRRIDRGAVRRRPPRLPGRRDSEGSSMSTTPLLEVRGIDKSFGPVQVLRKVDLAVPPGEVTALVGDNGAAKSTLGKCISGIYSVDAGESRFAGRPVSLHGPRDAAALGIEIVYQDLALCDNLDIVANMFLGRERRSGVVLDEATMEELAARTLASLSVRTVTSLRQPVASLSGGQRQTVAIAKAVLWEGRVVILDEPTAALGVAQTAQVLELVRRLADHGLSVVMISHNLNDVFAVADRIAALYLGRTAAQVRTTDVTQAQVVELIT